MSGLHEKLDELVVGVPSYGDLDRAIEHASAERRRRAAVAASLSVAAAVLVAVVVVVSMTRGGHGTLQPTAPSSAATPAEMTSPTEMTSQPAKPANPMVNGRIQDISTYLASAPPSCDDCYLVGGAFDQDTGALLVFSWRKGFLVGLSVVDADGPLAELSCPDDFACGDAREGAATLGPGADELTVWLPGKQAQVIGYDGTVRRTIDLSAVLDESSEVQELAWSPDGRLAVLSRESSSGLVSHIWLVDDDGGDAQLVHTASTDPRDGKFPLAYLWSLAWSPDGRRLGFIEEHALIRSVEESLSIEAISLLVPEPGQEGPGTAEPLYDYATRPFDYAAFMWSPDGTRMAIRIPDYVLELSPDDGSVLARHPFECQMSSDVCYPVIWPARLP